MLLEQVPVPLLLVPWLPVRLRQDLEPLLLPGCWSTPQWEMETPWLRPGRW